MKRLICWLVLIASGVFTHGAYAACDNNSGGGENTQNNQYIYGTKLKSYLLAATCNEYVLGSGETYYDLEKNYAVSNSDGSLSSFVSAETFSVSSSVQTLNYAQSVSTLSAFDVLTFSAATTGHTISFEVCYDIKINTSGVSAFVYGKDYASNKFGAGSTLLLTSQQQCKTGSFTLNTTSLTIPVSLEAELIGAIVNSAQGSLSGNMKVILPPEVSCVSASRFFPGCVSASTVKPEKCPMGCETSVGNPINFSLGFKHQNESDYSNGTLSFNRIYRSDATWYTNSVGQRWRHNFDRSVIVSGSTATVTTEDGLVYTYTLTGGVWVSNDPDMTATLQTISGGGYKYTLPNDTVETYNSSGQLTRIAYRGGASLTLAYPSGKLNSVTDEQGRSISFAYSGNRITSITTPAGIYSYEYDGNNNLIKVTKPDTKKRQYHYENASFVNALTGITNEKLVRFATYGYDTQGRAVLSKHAGDVDSYSVTYNANGTVTTTNPLGKQTTYTFQTIQGVRKIVGVEGHASTNCAAANKSYTYDANGFLESKTDWKGNQTTYTRNSKGLVTSMTEGYGSSAERTTTTSYISGTSLPDVVTVGNLSTDYGYDSSLRMTSKAVTDTATGTTRTTTYSYYPNTTDGSGNTVLGKLQTVNGSRTDVTDITTYTYTSGGDLWKTTNALGHVTEIYARDSAGRPTEILDANGTKTKMEYDTLGRLTKVTEGFNTSPVTGITTYSYNDDGSLFKMTLANGVYLKHYYDDAGREYKILNADSAEYYFYDAAGNLTETRRKTNVSGSPITYRKYNTYDELSRLLSTRNNTNQTDFSYDLNGNITAQSDATNNANSYEYDARDRLTEVMDKLGGITLYDLSTLDQTEAVTDPRNIQTTYTYNAFGDVLTEVSPDRGTMTYVYDLAGNKTSMTDGRGKVTNYTYDVLNRLTSIVYTTNTTNNVTLQYDLSSGCGAYKGKLCRVIDASGTTNYAYSVLGDLTSVTETRSGATFTTSYTYDNAHYLTGITYPSGRSMTYAYNLNGDIASVTTSKSGVNTTLASGVAYMPFGGVSSLTYGNGLTETNTYDDAYRLTGRSVGSVLSDTYAYDTRNNVETKNTTTYGYDALDRLIQDGAVSISVDEIGNRTSMGGVSYTYGSGTSRLTGITQGGSTTTLSYYGGYQTGDGVKTYVWDGAGRLRTISDAGGTLATYTYDAQHHRTKKVTGGTTTHYVYGAGGVLYGEYSSTGALVREYVYLHGRPLAQVDAGTPETITYLHTDHLGTPRAGSNSSGASVWAWASVHNGFGATAPTGTKTVNLRFAGQYFDTESGLFYNWNRYYNPSTGRYISSDPIGLGGGLNTYAYAAANPVMFTDPEGLLSDEQAFEHYRKGSGDPMAMDINNIDTSEVKPSDFPRIKRLISTSCQGCVSRTFYLEDRMAFSTYGTENEYLLGDITLKLMGEFTINGDKWSFSGKLKVFDDIYDFNLSSHRDAAAEGLTAIGSVIPGKEFVIEMYGEKPMEEEGCFRQ